MLKTTLLALLGVAQAFAQTTVSVSSTASHAIPTTLWGQMFEDISSGDGGLYGELLQNRAFQQVSPGTTAALAGWEAISGAQISVVADNIPVSSALPNSLSVVIPNNASGSVGVGNTGYYGIKVQAGSTYTASFYYRFPTSSSFSGQATLALQTTAGQVLGSTTVTLSGSQTSWKQITAKITPSTTPSSTSNIFALTVPGSSLKGQTINFAMFSLFPPTFKGRANGMRQDIAQALADLGPSFFRLPGGNNLGQTVATRWQWNNTVGPLVDRPGRQGDWGYVNTDGLGLYEYLEWCEDVGMQAIMAVWSGYALGGTSVAQNDLQPYIQQAIDQINFVIGDASESTAAAMRASLGHPEPFPLAFVEIGNEDFLASSTYTYRWTAFANALKAAFPNIKFLATTDVNSPVLSPKPQAYDVHVYQTPTWFAQNAFYYDSFARDGTLYFEGEYAAISTNANDIFGSVSDGRLEYPTMQSSTGEAAFMTGLERNSDIVFAASYAPLLNHVSQTDWTPNLLSFDAGNVYKSTSYYTQQLFSLNRGDEYIPSTLPSTNGTLFWSVVRKTSISPNQIILKVVNTAGSGSSVVFSLPFSVSGSASLQLLSGSETASNTPSAPNTVTPKTSTISVSSKFTYSAPAYSISVITLTTT